MERVYNKTHCEVMNKGEVKISDFGLARCVGGLDGSYVSFSGRLPIRWLAPESFPNKLRFRFSAASDVFAPSSYLLWRVKGRGATEGGPSASCCGRS